MYPIRVGIVGVGHLGEAHLQKYRAIPEADLVGFWDIDENVRKTVPEQYGVRAYKSLESLLAEVEAVNIVVPTSEHAEIAVTAAEKGVHLFVEKPIASTLAEADTIIDAGRKHGVKLQVGHIERFNAAYRSLEKEMINPRFIESHRLASFNQRGMDVSVVLDLMIHDLDLIFQLMQSPLDRIDASGVGVVSDSIDIVNVRLTFADGAVANVTASRISQKKMRKMRLFQRDSYISMDFVTGESEVFRIMDTHGGSGEEGTMPIMKISHENVMKNVGYRKIPNDGKDALELELCSFLDCIKHDTDPPVTGEEARKVLETAIQIADKTGAV